MQETNGHRVGGWQPLMLALDLPPLTVSGAQIGEQKLAVWRDSHGQVHASDDRCPHRGMRLSLGFVREDMLACLYHGWRFDESGHCRVIPAHPGVTPASTICVPVFPVAECMGLIWSRADGVATGAGPETEWRLPEGGSVTPVRTLTIKASLKTVMARLGATAGQSVRMLVTTGSGAVLPLLIVARPVGHDRTQCHLLLEGTVSQEDCEQAAFWAKDFRNTAERCDTGADYCV
ncbi:Rieske 2Fe-2S domain-containing protein [Acetobacter fallax]|uniref:Rieske 2Fe-2S domain-containing protein n=1 Tax=Acetobacter fallax TaxID=1737473 RepID=UPI0018EA22FA|nr:Rieske 2Fe-2S domain-containing protein [Acetobacter fallax]